MGSAMTKRMKRTALLAALLIALLGVRAQAARFPDVPDGAWYAGVVNEMAKAGVVTGFPDGTFGPDKTISCAEYATITARLAGMATGSGDGHWAGGTMRSALAAQWYDWDEIPPAAENYDRPVTRQLAAKIMMRALLPGVRGDYAVESAKIRDFSALDGRYYEPVLAAYATGLIVGDGEGRFRPTDTLTRAEACAIFRRAAKLAVNGAPPETVQPETPAPAVYRASGVSQNGKLRVEGTRLVNEKGEPVLLRGMSSHGLHWFPQYASAAAIRNTAERGANVFRVAMYTGEGGYLSRKDKVRAQLIDAVDAAIAQDIYVIIDWHILSDGNPSDHTAEAVAFFTDMARRYGREDAVLFEICNEPNGNVTWARDVKPYAEQVVAAIRAQGADNVILIGSPTWSQDIHLAAADPVQGENLMYTLHFYAGTHGEWLRRRVDDCLGKGLPVFVSEWGTSRADGSGGVFLDESRVWLDFLEQRGVSWCNWSLCDKGETSAALKSGTSADKTWTEQDLTLSGQFVFSRFALD